MNPETLTSLRDKATQESHFSQACLMLCDVSDFVKVANNHDRLLGFKNGSERTKLWFEHIFTRIVQDIEANGGLVVQLIGDAVVACFDIQNARQAVLCALSIKAEFEKNSSERLLAKIKTAVCVDRYSIHSTSDGTNKEIQTIVGEGFLASLKAIQRAEKHDVVANSNLLELCKKNNFNLRTTKLDGDFFRLHEHPDLLNQSPKATTISTVSRKSNEIKLLTILYLEAAIQKTSEGAIQLLDRICKELIPITEPFSAKLSGLCETEKGFRFQYVFGSIKSEFDEVERAIQFVTLAKETIQQIEGVQHTRASLGYGHSWQGEQHSPGKSFFSVHGREINLAARLLEKTDENCIYITENAYSQLSDQDGIIDKGLSYIRGEEREIRFFSVPPSYNPFTTKQIINRAFGRDTELRFLLRIIKEARDAKRKCILEISGSAGVGKSTLLKEITTHLRSDQQVIIELRANPNTQAFPYAIVYPLLSGLAKLRRIHHFESWAESQLYNNFTLFPLLCLINAITPYRFKHNEELGELTLDVKTKATIDLCSALVEKLSPKDSFTLVVEDLQFFDALSIQLLQKILKSEVLKSCIYTIRAEPGNRRTKDLRDKLQELGPGLRQFHLGNLNPSTTEQFLRGYFSNDLIPNPLIDAVFKLSSGNLMLITAFLKRIETDGTVIKLTDGSLQIDYDKLEHLSSIPTSLEHAIQTRIDLLVEPHRQVLYNCAIFKSPFKFTELQNSFSYNNKRALTHSIQYLLKEHILRIVRLDDHNEYIQFEHQLIEQCIYDRIPSEERKTMHHKYATWLENNVTSNRLTLDNMRLIRLAAQYKWAGQLNKAAPLTRSAVFFAFEIGALDSAMEHINTLLQWYEKTLLTPQSTLEIALLMEKKARIYSARGNLTSAIEQYKRTLDQLEYPHPDCSNDSIDKVTEMFIDIYRKGIANKQSKSKTRYATLEEELAIRVYTTIGELYFYQGTSQVGHLYLLAGVSSSSNLIFTSADLVKAYTGCVILAQILGQDIWIEHFKELSYSSLTLITQESEKYKATAYVNHRLGYMEYSAGKFDNAFRMLQTAIEAAQAGSEYYIQILASASIVTIRVAQGRFEEALIYYAKYEKLANKFASNYLNIFHQYSLVNQKVYCLAALGRFNEAHETLEKLERIAREMNFPQVLLLAVARGKLMLLYKSQRWREARSLAVSMAKNLTPDIYEKAYLFTCVSLPAEVLTEAEFQDCTLTYDENRIRETLVEIMETVKQKFPLAEPTYLILKAQLEIKKKKSRNHVRKLLQRAIQQSENSGQLVESKKANILLLHLEKK